MKTILKVNFFFYIVFLITIFTGHFKMFITITLITIFHELGHIIAGTILKYKIEEIRLMPFGLVTVFNKKINEPFISDIILTLAGPLFQLALFLVIKDPKITVLNKALLLFNLLPIIPLDGSKLLNLAFEQICSYRLSYILTFIVSILTIIFLIRLNLIVIIVLILYLLSNIKYILDIYFYFNKFILERYLYKTKYKKNNVIRNKKMTKMKKFQKNIFINAKNIENEHDFLNDLFDNR